MKKSDLYLIYGNFFQPSERFCAAMGFPGADILGIRDFHGIISCNSEVWTGQMKDRWGDSDLRDIELSPDVKFNFTKQYRGRGDVIEYKFKWDVKNECRDGTWEMKEEGRTRDRGLAKTCLIPVTPAFFAYEGVTEVVEG